ncbi:O-antigen ligase family protein [Shewanella sp. OMA3-2]|uniref:O-antigen ligase family protein n=1 Tax=Shewanella sp. OMA3-2 TaxID=2908650 RepID=UPI001F1A5A27|nr:O-antigen ligase family protein [Shewanella sp. OMA3-2]UJF23369.1 O-antigen ligase family protein [Shewanella sp. OMA3-2]
MLIDFVFALTLLISLLSLTILIFKGMNCAPSSTLMFLLACFLFVTEANFRNRELDDSSIDFQILLRLGVWLLITTYTLVYYKRVFSLLLDVNVRFLTLFCIFCFISTIYSPIPVYTAVNSLVQLCFLIFAASIAINLDLTKICMAIFYMSILFHSISLILVPIFPELTVMEFWGQGEIGGTRITGLSGSANAYGQMAGLAIVITQYLRKKIIIGKLLYVSAILLFSFCIIASWSRTSIFIAIVGLFIIEKELVLKYIYHYILLSIFAVITYFMIFDVDDLLLKFSRNGSIEEILTFTGRTDIWAAVWNEALLSPVVGYGYASTKLLLPQIFETEWGWSTVTAHSMFFQSFFTTGFIGVFLLFSTLFIFLKLCGIIKDRFISYIFFLVVINGILESGIGGPIPNTLSFLFFLFYLVAIKKYNENTKG